MPEWLSDLVDWAAIYFAVLVLTGCQAATPPPPPVGIAPVGRQVELILLGSKLRPEAEAAVKSAEAGGFGEYDRILIVAAYCDVVYGEKWVLGDNGHRATEARVVELLRKSRPGWAILVMTYPAPWRA